MVCTFIRARVVCTTKELAYQIKEMFDPVINTEDFLLQDPKIYLEYDDIKNNHICNIDMYVKEEVIADSYTSQFIDAFELQEDKSGFISFTIIKNNNCTHDEEFPSPDVVEEVYSYGS